MKSRVLAVSLLVWVWGASVPAQAGWVAEARNTAIKSNGDRLSPEPTTMQIADGKVRLVQPNSVSLIDYNKGKFTILNPQRESYWTGTVDEYVTEVVRNRQESAKRRFGEGAAAHFESPKLAEAGLPKITVKKTDESQTIAGHQTVKYVVETEGQAFQEIWLAEDLNLSGDLDPKKYLAYQEKMNGAMLGKVAAINKAAYRNEDYRKLHEKGFILQMITRHVAGGFERVFTSIRRADISASEFEVPENYRRVRLSDVFPTDGQS